MCVNLHSPENVYFIVKQKLFSIGFTGDYHFSFHLTLCFGEMKKKCHLLYFSLSNY